MANKEVPRPTWCQSEGKNHEPTLCCVATGEVCSDPAGSGVVTAHQTDGSSVKMDGWITFGMFE